MAGVEIHRSCVDSGERWMLYDAGGQHLLAWDSRDHEVRCAYDALRRPTTLSVRPTAPPSASLSEVLYGESSGRRAGTEPSRRRLQARRTRRASRRPTQRDFKGNIVSTSPPAARSDYGQRRGLVD